MRRTLAKLHEIWQQFETQHMVLAFTYGVSAWLHIEVLISMAYIMVMTMEVRHAHTRRGL